MFDPSSASKNSFLEFNSPLYPNNNQAFDDPLHPFSHPKNHNLALWSDYQLGELEISGTTDTSLIASVEAASNLVREQLAEVVLSAEYDEITGLAFGESYNQQIANSIWQSFAQGDLSELPNIQVISSDILGNANGAYAKQIDTIFLSDRFVRSHNTQEIVGVLTEEIGHYIDDRINTVDSAGDEGDIFSRLVRGESLSGADLALLKEEDDSAVIFLNGQEVAIEKNDTLSTAYNIGTLNSSRSFSDWVGSADTNDYYRFYVGSQSNFSLGLTGLTADADVQLLNSSGSVITSSTLTGSSSEFINRQLGTGIYYVRVFPYSGSTNYNLSLNATPVAPPDYAGNSTSAARDLGTLNSSRSFSDWVGSADTNDYYRFYVGSQSNFSLGLTGLTADADVQLLNSSGTVITSSSLSGSSSESINTQLSTGTYFVRVFPFSGSTNYNLSLNATPVDYAGNTLTTARDLGTLNSSRSFSDWVGSADTNDYYRFYVGSQSNFSLGLTGLTADADVQLLNSSGSVITSSTLSGSSSESINTQLSTGTYYVRVFPFNGANTNYNLSLNATPVAPPDYAGNSTSAARDLGTLNSSRSFSDWVGSADTNDYYRFYVGSQSNFSLGLTGLTADADVQLLNSSGSVITSSTLSGSSSESINTQLGTGTYFVRVFPFSGSTNYNLSLNATPVDYAGNTLTTARDLGTLNSSRSFSDWVGSADTNDYYRFYVGSQSNFSLGLTGLTADADVQLLNSSGTVITSSALTGSSSESINRQLGTGTYYVRVFPFNGANTNYSLNLSGVSLSSQVRSGSENINLWLYDTNGRNTTGYINPNRETVVVIHGWNNNDQIEHINRLAREAAEFGQQVLALDWGGIANDPDELDSWWGDAVPDQTAQWITPVARWASNLLGNLGIASNQLTLIGHSLGTYVASEIGRIGGQVRNLVALDPANNPDDNQGLYDLDIYTPGTQRPVRFDSVAQYSLSFVVGDLDHGLAGNNNQAATAHDSFVIDDWGQYWSTRTPDDWAHGAVVDLFRNALYRELLSPTNLTMPSHQDNWYNNNGDRNNGQHEGYINASWVNNDWRIAGLRRVIDSSGTEQWAWT